MKLNVYDSKEKLNEALALWICDLVESVLQKQEYFTLALSGGETPKALYKKLASEQYFQKINWQRIHVFWGDERCVPFEDERNNANMAYTNLLNYVNMPQAQVHKMRVDIEPSFAAKDYENVLQTYFENTQNSFDLVLLGVGDDGHTLSLFPGSSAIEEKQTWVVAVYNEKQKMYRISLMPSIVNRASHIAFVATGKNKSEILHRVINGQYEPDVLPAQIIKPLDGTLDWFLDKEAAEKLSK
ncbi:MAG: 6-phosphogluconolactonase [Ginsengibacter sp.]